MITKAKRPYTLYAGVGVLTAATLILELVLTRIFSVVMFYHFAFLAISLALFGLGVSGVYVYLKPKLAQPENLFRTFSIYGLAAGITTFVALAYLLIAGPQLQAADKHIFTLVMVYILSALPFFFSGVCLTVAIQVYQADMGRVYFFDLLGAGIGCLLLNPMLGAFGGIHTMLIAGLLFVLSAMILQLAHREGKTTALLGTTVGGSVILVGFFAINAITPILHIPSVKETHEGTVVFSKWNSFSRVTVEKTAKTHYWLKMDSSAATRIFRKHIVNKNPNYIFRDPEIRLTSVAYSLRTPGKVLIIGPGGGTDVLTAYSFGNRDITGVELNPIIVNLMKTNFRDESGNLYGKPGIRVVAAEGRSFVRSSPHRYSVIQATLVDTWSATAAGAFTLSENTLYTRQAFRDYLAHLTPNGVLTMTRWFNRPPREFMRLLVLARAGLDDIGAKDHAKHIYIAAFTRSASLILKRTPFTRAEVAKLDRYVKRSGLRTFHSPFKRYHNPYANLAHAASWKERIARQNYDLRPPTDDRPFFFYTIKPSQFISVIGSFNKLDQHNRSLWILLVLLGIVFVLVLLFFLLPLLAFGRSVLQEDRVGRLRYLLFFLSLGAGFITVEIALMQKFILFLGHPSYALIVVLFCLLIFSGIGSLSVSKVPPARINRTLLQQMGIFFGILMLYLTMLSGMFDHLVGLPFTIRLILSCFLLAPLGLYMGSFLPLAVQGAGERFGALVPWGWGVNGASSVLGSVLTITLALNLGFDLTLLIGLGFYIFGFLIIQGLLSPQTN